MVWYSRVQRPTSHSIGHFVDGPVLDKLDGKFPTLQQQEAQLMLTTGSTRLAVSRGQQIWYHSTCRP